MSSILVVENDPLSRDLAERVLRAGGHKVIAVSSAEEALRRVKSIQPDLVLMDLNMPGIDGLEATRRLRSDPDTADLAVAILSAQMFDDDVERARKAGCDDYLSKPIGAGELLVRVKEILSRPLREGKLARGSL